MENKQNTKKNRRTWIEYAILGAIALTLYLTGYHTEVIGFAQRGILATGLMNPDVEEVALQASSSEQPLIPAGFNLTLTDADGNQLHMSSLKGKVIFLNLWATWCPPCIAEMPSIAELHDELGNDVAFVMLSLDQDFKKAIAFNNRKAYNLPIYALASNLPDTYESTAIPTTYIIDKTGNIVLTHKGMANYSSESFKKFLKEMQ